MALLTCIRAVWVRKPQTLLGPLVWLGRSLAYSFLFIVVAITKRREGMTILCLYAYSRAIDDVVDGDWPLPKGYEQAGFLSQKKAIIRAVCSSPDEGEEVKVFPEDCLFVYLIEEGRNIYPDFPADLQELWALYLDEHQELVSAGFVSTATSRGLQSRSNTLLIWLVFKALGMDDPLYQSISERLQQIMQDCDNICDVAQDLRKGRVCLPPELLRLSGVTNIADEDSLKLFLRSEPFLEWRRLEVTRLEQAWRTLHYELSEQLAQSTLSRLNRLCVDFALIKETDRWVRKARSVTTSEPVT